MSQSLYCADVITPANETWPLSAPKYWKKLSFIEEIPISIKIWFGQNISKFCIDKTEKGANNFVGIIKSIDTSTAGFSVL